MFGLTTRRRLRKAQLENVGLNAQLGFLQGMYKAEAQGRIRAQVPLCDEIDAHLATIRRLISAENALDTERRTTRILAEHLLVSARPTGTEPTTPKTGPTIRIGDIELRFDDPEAGR